MFPGCGVEITTEEDRQQKVTRYCFGLLIPMMIKHLLGGWKIDWQCTHCRRVI